MWCYHFMTFIWPCLSLLLVPLMSDCHSQVTCGTFCRAELHRAEGGHPTGGWVPVHRHVLSLRGQPLPLPLPSYLTSMLALWPDVNWGSCPLCPVLGPHNQCYQEDLLKIGKKRCVPSTSSQKYVFTSTFKYFVHFSKWASPADSLSQALCSLCLSAVG